MKKTAREKYRAVHAALQIAPDASAATWRVMVILRAKIKRDEKLGDEDAAMLDLLYRKFGGKNE